MRSRDIWTAWTAMIAAAMFAAIMIGPAHAQHGVHGGWHGGFHGGMRGPVVRGPVIHGQGLGGWSGRGYPYIQQRPYYPRRGDFWPGAVVGGLAAGVAGLASGVVAEPDYTGNPCWRYDPVAGWYYVC